MVRYGPRPNHGPTDDDVAGMIRAHHNPGVSTWQFR
jgi:hypothetical protein